MSAEFKSFKTKSKDDFVPKHIKEPSVLSSFVKPRAEYSRGEISPTLKNFVRRKGSTFVPPRTSRQSLVIRESPKTQFHQQRLIKYIGSAHAQTQFLQNFISKSSEKPKTKVLPPPDTIVSETAQDTILDEVTDILTSSSLDTSSRVKAILSVTTKRLETKGVTKTFGEGIRRWIQQEWRCILWNAAIVTAATATIILATVFFGAGSWLALLAALKYAAINVVPYAIGQALVGVVGRQAVGMSIDGVMKLARKNKRVRTILEKKIPTAYAQGILNRMGVDPNNLTIESVTRKIITDTASTAGSGLLFGNVMGLGGIANSLFISNGISVATQVARGAVSTASSGVSQVKNMTTKLVQSSEKVSQRAVKEVFKEKSPTEVSSATVREIERSVRRTKVGPPRTYTPKSPRNITETSSSIRSTIAENKATAVAGATALSFVALALTGNLEGVVNIISNLSPDSEIASKIFMSLSDSTTLNFVKNSKMAQTFVVRQLLGTFGVDKIIDALGETLIPESNKKKMKSLASKLREEKNASRISKYSKKMMMLMMGGKYYTAIELSKMNISELKKIYKQRLNVKTVKTNSSKEIINHILQIQEQRVAGISSLMGGILKETLKDATANLATTAMAEGYKTVDEMLNRVEEVQEKIRIEDEIDIDIPGSSEPGTKSFRDLDISPEEAKEIAARERIEARARLREEAKAKMKEIEAQKKLLKEEKMKKMLERRAKKLEKISERETTKISAKIEQQLRDTQTIIVTPEGDAVPVASDETLIPEQFREVLEEMGEFTPLIGTLTRETLKATTNWIPGIGWMNSAIQTANIGLQAAELTGQIGQISEIITSIAEGKLEFDDVTTEDIARWKRLSTVGKTRIPTLGQAIDNVIQVDKKAWVDVASRIVRDMTIEKGLGKDVDATKVFLSLGKEILGDTSDLSIDVVKQAGESFFNKLFG
jgi:hypothetical protein